jgi:hypothetical protein
MTAILDEITKALDWLWDATPGVVKFLFFMGLVLIIGNFLFPLAFMLTGTFCSGGEMYSGSALKFWKNPINMWESFNVDENSSNGTLNVHPDYGLVGVFDMVNNDCTKKLTVNGSQMYFYKGGCTSCTPINSSSAYYGNGTAEEYFTILTASNYCEGDAYPQDNPWWNPFCYGWRPGSCLIKDGYHYDQSTNLLRCDQDWCLTISEATVRQTNFLSDGYKRVDNQTAIEFGPRCFVASNLPKFQVFGVEVFNYQYWLLITLIIILVWAWITFVK